MTNGDFVNRMISQKILKNTVRENGFIRKLTIKIQSRYFSGSTPLTPNFFRLNTVNANLIPVQRRLRHYFSSSTPLPPLCFRFNSVNVAIFPVQRR